MRNRRTQTANGQSLSVVPYLEREFPVSPFFSRDHQQPVLHRVPNNVSSLGRSTQSRLWQLLRENRQSPPIAVFEIGTGQHAMLSHGAQSREIGNLCQDYTLQNLTTKPSPVKVFFFFLLLCEEILKPHLQPIERDTLCSGNPLDLQPVLFLLKPGFRANTILGCLPVPSTCPCLESGVPGVKWSGNPNATH